MAFKQHFSDYRTQLWQNGLLPALCTVAGSGTNNFRELFTTQKQTRRRERVAYACLRPAETFMRACLRTTEAARFCLWKGANSRLLNVAGVERFSDTHMQPLSVSDRHAKCCVRYIRMCKQYLAYFSYTETVKCMRVWDEDDICFTLMNIVFKQS